MSINFIKKFVPQPVFSLYHLGLGFVGNALNLFPSRKLHLIGITGTKGKTTTAYFAYQMFLQNKKRVALTSTVMFAIGRKTEPNLTKMGMPGRFFLPRFLRRAYLSGMEYAIIESTSEGIAQHRARFLDYNTVVFTGLSPEHIERHGGFVNYRKAKEKLFKKCQGVHIINLKDKYAHYFWSYPAKEKWGVVLDKKDIHQYAPAGIRRMIVGKTLKEGRIKISEVEVRKKEIVLEEAMVKLPFIGKFNGLNVLTAFAIGRSVGISFSDLAKTIAKLKLPEGRVEEIKNKKINYRLFLDYAHEPLSLKSVLEACREILPKGKKLICLTGGQGGGRDRWKRKVMGAIASKLSDYVIIATEDPYDENPEKINWDILQGVLSNKKFREGKNCFVFLDRQEGIKKALSLAKKDDIVLLAGKGGEKKMCVGEKMIPWNEREVVEEILKV